MENDKTGLWQQALQHIKREVSPQSYETWFLPVKQAGFENDILKLGVPNRFFKAWLLDHYKDAIQKAVSLAAQKNIDFDIEIDELESKHEQARAKSAEKRVWDFSAGHWRGLPSPKYISTQNIILNLSLSAQVTALRRPQPWP